MQFAMGNNAAATAQWQGAQPQNTPSGTTKDIRMKTEELDRNS
jgi:hypothetical protein